MDLVELTEFLIKSMATNPKMVGAKKVLEDEKIIQILVVVDPKDMGLIIGKNGVNSNAVRTIVQVAAYINKINKFININIETF